MNRTRLIGAGLIVAALVAAVVLTLTGHPVPSLVTTIALAGISLATHAIADAQQKAELLAHKIMIAALQKPDGSAAPAPPAPPPPPDGAKP